MYLRISIAAAAVVFALWGLYRYRIRLRAREYSVRFAERIEERNRIARELHDTVLQSVQGLMLCLQVVEDILPEGKAKRQLGHALECGDQAITEGRDAIYNLRRSATATNHLAEAVRALAPELVTAESPSLNVVVQGRARDLNPIVRDEVYRITQEALRNSFRHARARSIDTEIVYGARALSVRVRDDGEGIQPEMLRNGSDGHYGLQGMRERARRVGANLEISSRTGSGTEIQVTVAGAVAYLSSHNRSRVRLLEERHGDV